jgi:hypothetical protein
LVVAVGATALVRGARSTSQEGLAAGGDENAARAAAQAGVSNARTRAGDQAHGGQGQAAPNDDGAPVLVRFIFEAHGARRVAVAGSFNAWKEQVLTLEDGGSDGPSAGVFVTTVAVPRGTHEYMFVVDGRWIADPLATERRPDGFGRQNSLLRL